MLRQHAIRFAAGLLILSSLACNAFAGATEPALTLPPPLITEEVNTPAPAGEGGAVATATLAGTATAEEEPAAAGEAAVIVLVDLNVRSGPGVQYDIVGFLLKGESVPVVGRDPDTGWWKIECPPRAGGPECWLSGGAQYTTAENVEGVPVAAVPPTPTPVPPTLPPHTGLVTYVGDDGLWALPLDLNEDPPAAGEPTRLTSNPDVQQSFISPDGQKVAYMVGASGVNQIHVIHIDGSGERMLVKSTDLPVELEGDAPDFSVLIGAVQWLGDSQSLAFNTRVVNLVGPGVGEREDLWTVTLDGTLTERFAAGMGGGRFAISRNNQVIFGQAEQIVRVNLDGSSQEIMIAFDPINTASEYAYYPRPQWTADASAAYVAIPSAEPFSDDATAALWRIPASGPAQPLASLPGNILFNDVIWSPNGRRLAYGYVDVTLLNPPLALMLGDSNGQNPDPYAVNDQLAFYGWSVNESHFLYSGAGFYAVGQVGEFPVETSLPAGQTTARAEWLTDSTFVVASGSLGDWDLSSGNVAGASTLLVSGNRTAVFDVWAP